MAFLADFTFMKNSSSGASSRMKLSSKSWLRAVVFFAFTVDGALEGKSEAPVWSLLVPGINSTWLVRKSILGLTLQSQGFPRTRWLVAMEPPGLLWQTLASKLLSDSKKRKHFRKSKHLLRSEVSWCDLHLRRSTCTIVSRSIDMLSVTDFVRKWIISGVRVQAGLHLDMLDADRSPNMQSAFLPELHRWISKLIARHLHACPPGDLLITMVKKTVILFKKEFRKMKKSRISPWSERDENAKWLRDCLWLCQACKCGFTCMPM